MKKIKKGISLFAGMGHPLADSLTYLENAKAAGFSELFTSLHIPEANNKTLLSELDALLAKATELDFAVTADISPRTFRFFGGSLQNTAALARLGLAALRLDDGFTCADIVRLTHEQQWSICLNTSTTTAADLQQLLDNGVYASRLQSSHNYYPRPETGLSWKLFAERCRLFAAQGIEVAAFVPSLHNPRGPLFAGLPTLEAHRTLAAQTAAQVLAASGLVQGLFFGDPLATKEELLAVGRVETQLLSLRLQLEPDLSPIERLLLDASHTNRHDPGAACARSQEARGLCTEDVPPRPAQPRPRGCVTIDNSGYGRYQGELQIVQQDLPADPRVNVVAHIEPTELFLLDYLEPGRSFAFEISSGGTP